MDDQRAPAAGVRSKRIATALQPGGRLGPYEITATLRQGGMEEVEPSCGREPFADAQGTLRGSPRAESRPGAQRRPERADGVPRGLRGISC